MHQIDIRTSILHQEDERDQHSRDGHSEWVVVECMVGALVTVNMVVMVVMVYWGIRGRMIVIVLLLLLF